MPDPTAVQVEAAAHALYSDAWIDRGLPWERVGDRAQDVYRERARVALTAALAAGYDDPPEDDDRIDDVLDAVADALARQGGLTAPAEPAQWTVDRGVPDDTRMPMWNGHAVIAGDVLTVEQERALVALILNRPPTPDLRDTDDGRRAIADWIAEHLPTPQAVYSWLDVHLAPDSPVNTYRIRQVLDAVAALAAPQAPPAAPDLPGPDVRLPGWGDSPDPVQSDPRKWR